MYDYDKMDMKLREFLLVILDDLSDLDRCRLHFVLGKEIPRRLRQISNIENTIQVFEYLIDTGKIFTSLSNGLLACGKLNWSNKLKEFEQMSSLPMTHSLPSSRTNHTITQLVLDDLTDDEEEDSGIS